MGVFDRLSTIVKAQTNKLKEAEVAKEILNTPL